MKPGLAALAVLVLLSLVMGPASIEWRALVESLMPGSAPEPFGWLVLELRFARTLLAVMTGAVLAVGGAVMQGLFRNPLAEPGLVGVSAGAALGAVAVMMTGLTSALLVGAAGFVGALIATGLAWQLARHQSGSAGLLLAGIAINALALSLISLLISMASDQQIRSVTFWSLGSMARTPLVVVLFLLPWVGLGLWALYRQWPALNALHLGEQQAEQVGVSVNRVRFFLIVTMALVVGPLVGFTGAISFVGLLVPQLLRQFLGGNHQRLLPLAAIVGAMVVLVADMLSRWLVAPAELPIGVVISLVGAPLFLWLLQRTFSHSPSESQSSSTL
jgi:iron complex transport system permease protein